ncbi:SCO5918 family protein [Streptomyces sp. EN27]|uniref:SCO5918 family protein n=1 Tax=Streptomyces sp. EN27 TaxID=211464 RepID=UPI000AEC05F4
MVISRRVYPVKQVGGAITRQDRRNYSFAEVVRALPEPGFTCHTAESAVPVPAPAPYPAGYGFQAPGAPARGAKRGPPSGVRNPGPSRSETCPTALPRRLRALWGVR